MSKNRIPERGYTTSADRENHGGSGLGTSSCSATLEAELREAWKIIDVLYMDALDHNGESWPRAREWQERNQRFSPQNSQDQERKKTAREWSDYLDIEVDLSNDDSEQISYKQFLLSYT